MFIGGVDATDNFLVLHLVPERKPGIGCGSISRFLRWSPDPVMVNIRDNQDYIKDLVYSYYVDGPPKITCWLFVGNGEVPKWRSPHRIPT